MVIAEYKFNKALNTLPLVNGGYSYTYSDVDNGDNTITRTISTDTAPTSINFEYCDGLLEVYFLNISGMTSFDGMFAECYNLVSVNTADWDTSRITSMVNLFVGCESLVSLDISNWITNQVRNMSYIFTRCLSLTEIKGIENLNTANVTNMASMFRSCSSLFNLNLSNWNTSNVTNMYQMFNNCNKLTSLDLSNWNVGKVTNMDNIFSYSSIVNLNLTGWNFNSSVITSYSNYMFNNCTGLNRIIIYKSNINSVNKIIKELPTRTDSSHGIISIGDINLSSVDTATASSKYWDVVNYIVAIYTFNSDTDILPIFNDGFTYTYEDMVEEIFGLEWLDKQLSPNTGGVSTESGAHTNFIPVTPGERYHIDIDYARVFWYDENQNFISQALHGNNETITGSDGKEYATNGKYAIAPENARYMCLSRGHGDAEIKIFTDTITRTIISDNLPTKISFSGKTGLVSVSYLDVSSVTDMSYMFATCTNLTSIDLSYLDTSNVTDMSHMFFNCTNLTSIDLSSFNTSNVTNMSYMFYKCSNLTSLNLSSFNTNNVTDMDCMFYNCRLLTSLDLSNFDTSKVKDIGWMFYGCEKLITLNLSSFDTSKVTNMRYMLYNCSNLTSVNMNNSDVDSINKIITELPDRTNNSLGTLDVTCKGDISLIDIITADSKNWTVNYSRIENINQLRLCDKIISNLYIGEVEIKKVCLGDIVVYENKQATNNVDTLHNEFTNTLFVLEENALSYDENELNLIVNSDAVEVNYDNENLNIGGDSE